MRAPQLLLARLLLLLLLPVGQATLPSAQNNGLTLTAQAGFDGLTKTSAAVPVIVTARNDGPPVEGELRVLVSGSAAPGELVYSAPLSLPTGADKRVPLVVYVPPFAGQLAVQLLSDDAVIAETQTNRLSAIIRDDLLYGIITPDPGGLAFLETIPGGRSDSAVAFLDLADLPEVSPAWNALDVVILDDTDTSRLTAGQSAAMRAWVESGGDLIVTGGSGGPRTAAGVADLLPVAISGVESVAALPALSEHTGREPDASGPYVVTAGDLSNGRTLIDQDGLPLLARREVGRGSVTILALDPKAAPLAGWAGGDQLWDEMAYAAPVLPPWAWGIQDGYAAAQAVSYIPGLRLPSVWQLILFLLIYTLVIGPLNFLVLRRLNRRELAWITIPALVLLFSAVTFATGFRTRGNAATLNVMSVAFGSAEAERLRTQTLMGLYSPRRADYDITLPYDSAAYPFSQGFGMNIGQGNLDDIARADDVTLRNVRTDTSEVATFVVEAHTPRPPVSAEAVLSAESHTIEVTIRNRTAETLEDAVIIYGQEQQAVGDVGPGEEETVMISLAGLSSAPPTTAPLFSPGITYPDPLINDPSLILGTADFFSDPVAYPRWQLIQARYTGEITTPPDLPDPTEIVTLGGWLAGSAQDAAVSGDNATGVNATQTGLTLLLLEIPVR